MGNPEHIKIIENSTVEEWNKWRQQNIRIRPDLTRVDLSSRDLQGIDFRGVGLFKANLSNSNLMNANLRQSIAIKANFSGTNLEGAHVYGISAWDIVLTEETNQKNLIISEPSQSIITVDNLNIAQLVHLMLHNPNIRDILQVIANKAVLILGRFGKGHLNVLQAIREKLRELDYLPILFDFEGPNNRNVTETIVTLAHISKYVIADLTYISSVPQELSFTIPNLPSVIFQPIIREGEEVYSMFEHFNRYPWVNDLVIYKNKEDLIDNFQDKVLKKLLGT